MSHRRSLLRGSRSGGGYDADYQAIINEANNNAYTLPSSTVQDQQNQIVLDLKSSGLWNKLDEIYIGGDDIADGNYLECSFNLMNWKSPTDKLTITNTSKVDKTNGYMRCQFYGQSFVSPYLADDIVNRSWNKDEGTIGTWVIPDGAYNSGSLMWNVGGGLTWRQRETSPPRVYWNRGPQYRLLAKSGGGALANPTMRMYSREDTATPKIQYYENGLLYSSVTALSPNNALASGNFVYFNVGVLAPANNTPIKIIIAGQLLTSTEHLALYNIFNPYFNSL